ncbi:RCC1/BLIP-II [Tothia fuscella]|uniref:RCC1/BLIP-II n=1 Tax=Tothia fuscella TaxID=1048955 RepID=A0A9P4U1Y1_9PEZI|nr:RCC1/BLIP-II [Tothia fuscella]
MVEPSKVMELYACGFNAHGQLGGMDTKKTSNTDIHTWEKISSGPDIKILFVGWSSLIVLVDSAIWISGQVQPVPTTNTDLLPTFILEEELDTEVESVYGSVLDGPIGVIDKERRMWEFARAPNYNESRIMLEPLPRQIIQGPDFIAMDYSGHVYAACPLDTVRKEYRLFEFSDYYTCSRWASLNHPYSTKNTPKHHHIPSTIKSLIAGATSFALLTIEGSVLTWGDTRYGGNLARLVSDEDPAATPCLVDALGGIPISKISTGGWIFGALSKDKDLYLWGSGKPGNQDRLVDLLELHAEIVTLVTIPGVENIIDFGIGASHVVVLAEGGTLWGIGANHNGQMSWQHHFRWVTEWSKLEMLPDRAVTSVACGQLCTVATVYAA